MINKNYFYIVVVICVAIIVFIKFNYNQKITESEQQHSQNIDALQLEIKKYKNSAGDNIFEKTTLITTIDNLKKINEELAKQVQINKNEVKTITQLKLLYEKKFNDLSNEYETLTRICRDKIDPNDVLGKLFDPNLDLFTLDWRIKSTDSTFLYDITGANCFNVQIDSTSKKDSFNIQIKNARTFLKNLKISTTLYTGIQYNKETKRYEIFATTPNDNIDFQLIGNIDEKMFLKNENSFVVGPYIGVGLGIPFNNTTTQFPNLSIGFGIMYKFWSF